MTTHLELIQLSKIFGPDSKTGLQALNQGVTKAGLLASTGNVIGVQDVNLRIKLGEIFVIMGLSGSGKSTLLRMINRLIEPSAGRVLFDNIDVTAMSERELVKLRRLKMNMVFQSFALLPHLSVIDNVAFGLIIAGVSKTDAQRRASEALKMVGIQEVSDHRPEQLSGGMQQRVGLARAWVTEPELMLMDEAFSALDPLIRTEMQDALLELQRNTKRTIVFVSHDLAEAMRIADRIAVMAEGRIRQVGTPTEIIENPADDYVRAFFHDVQPGRLFRAGDIAVPGETRPHSQPAVSADVLLNDLLPRAAESDVPIAVADEQGTVIGYIDRGRLLQALAKGQTGS